MQEVWTQISRATDFVRKELMRDVGGFISGAKERRKGREQIGGKGLDWTVESSGQGI